MALTVTGRVLKVEHYDGSKGGAPRDTADVEGLKVLITKEMRPSVYPGVLGSFQVIVSPGFGNRIDYVAYDFAPVNGNGK